MALIGGIEGVSSAGSFLRRPFTLTRRLYGEDQDIRIEGFMLVRPRQAAARSEAIASTDLSIDQYLSFAPNNLDTRFMP